TPIRHGQEHLHDHGEREVSDRQRLATRARLARGLRDASAERREQTLDVRALVHLGRVVGAPAGLRVGLARQGDRLNDAAVRAHVTAPGDPEQNSVLVLARAPTLLEIEARARRALDVDEVALRGARLAGDGPAATDPLDLSGGGDLATALLT